MINISLAQIKDYRLIHKTFEFNGHRFLAIREFILNNSKQVLAVDIDSLRTKIFPEKQIEFKQFEIKNSRYFRLIQKSISDKLYNGGLRNGNTDKVYLTVDLCPSSKKEAFEIKTMKNFLKKGYKNIAFSITGRWFLKNKKFVEWIKNSGLNVVWINHTFTHFYKRRLPLDKNFLMKKGTNLFYEITAVEKLLIENGITPSVFIRYPGLVADYRIRKTVAEKYGLIALGSDAWLALGQKVKEGSIILIHGNKNEPAGIKIFNKLLDRKKLKFDYLYNIKP
ncbi:hypothetical protein [Persephonella sp.]|uniref:hypothetical protein n=1 Tax=Persephonella sp. TaxID=2060922 RepID=UPI00260F570F|nr:hypothetical protein [Persephonella sp.]